jgi:hypothetical protein
MLFSFVVIEKIRLAQRALILRADREKCRTRMCEKNDNVVIRKALLNSRLMRKARVEERPLN